MGINLAILVDTIKLQDLNHNMGILGHEPNNLVVFKILNFFGSFCHVSIGQNYLENGWVRIYRFAGSSHYKLKKHEYLFYAHESVGDGLFDEVESRL